MLIVIFMLFCVYFHLVSRNTQSLFTAHRVRVMITIRLLSRIEFISAFTGWGRISSKTPAVKNYLLSGHSINFDDFTILRLKRMKI